MFQSSACLSAAALAVAICLSAMSTPRPVLADDQHCEGCHVSAGFPGLAVGDCNEQVKITVLGSSPGVCAFSESQAQCLESPCVASIKREWQGLPDDPTLEINFCRKTIGSSYPRQCDDPPLTIGAGGTSGSDTRTESVSCGETVRFSISAPDCNGNAPVANCQVACTSCTALGG